MEGHYAKQSGRVIQPHLLVQLYATRLSFVWSWVVALPRSLLGGNFQNIHLPVAAAPPPPRLAYRPEFLDVGVMEWKCAILT